MVTGKKKKVFITLGIVLVLGVVLYSLNSKDDKNAAKTEVVSPQISDMEETVTAQGKLEPKEYVDVGAQVSGQLKKVHVEIGDMVAKDQLLAEIDPKIYESRVEADKARLNTLGAQLAQQKAQAVFAQQQYERNERLIKSEAISKEALEESKSAFDVATAGVKSIQAQIQEANSTLKGDEANLSYTKIYAPMDGTVTTQTTLEGQTINANQQAPVIMQIANLDIMTVRAQVAEADVMRLNQDMEVYFTTLGSMETKWKGKIRQILPSPEVVNDVVLYNALIDVDNKDRKLMNGMSTQIFFVLGKADGALTIPAAALGKKVSDTEYMVKTESGEKKVTVGLMSRANVQVISGLDKNDKVVVPLKEEKPKTQRVPGPRI